MTQRFQLDDFLGELVGLGCAISRFVARSNGIFSCFLGEDLGLERSYSISDNQKENFATINFEGDCNKPTREVRAHRRSFDQMY